MTTKEVRERYIILTHAQLEAFLMRWVSEDEYEEYVAERLGRVL